MSTDEKFRLVTRSDFDGLVCAVLLEDMDLIDDVLFVHPKDMQAGEVAVTDLDITTNLPYVPGIHLAFDHHESEVVRLGKKFDNHIIDPDAPSAARVVYEYYGGKEAFPNVDVALMEAVDKGDSAQFTKEEVLNPTGWALLNFLMDARTGLGRFRGITSALLLSRQLALQGFELRLEVFDDAVRFVGQLHSFRTRALGLGLTLQNIFRWFAHSFADWGIQIRDWGAFLPAPDRNSPVICAIQ